MIKAVLLDVDGTLLDFQAYVRESLREGLPKFGIGTYTEDMFPVFTRVNNALWEALERGELDLDYIKAHRFQRVFEALRLTGDGPAFEEFFRKALFSSAIPVEGEAAMELLKYLKGKGYLLCVASNGPHAQQVNRLTLGGMLPYFDYLFVSESLGIQKPEARFGELALAQLRAGGHDLRPEELVIIGDSLTSDIRLGKNCGFKTCLYDPNGRHGAGSADWVIRSLHEVQQLL